MWSLPPTVDRWMLHVAASPHEVDEVLADLCLHQRSRAVTDPDFPACLIGPKNLGEPPAWMRFARTELDRLGYRTRWCDVGCVHHPLPQRIASLVTLG
ncbi:hypothetical protein ACWT_3222 [Actinoplanes sp. SE50]|uniref:hypothetical protein n=1 Tax=unclassified Actinoplanes TaxID=2626549 RepID=UPI00023EC965|nr:MULTISPECIES: hypothetical protein [unclassified Actinoplanes]AEV84245.1 hypothetical protein ACPL_3350 [Actinoplanes sp. SE50/110]ATO82637.1 hypothetical protein ACWT_3222 [Actinoplanes sp. SE50]SLM00044.1 hypothetical protein ACSP50_3276 [Actinoplanes sp. SE50/110]